MTIIKLENGIKLEPESDFERECLKHIAGQSLTAKFEDDWEKTGPLSLTFEKHPWDR